MMPPFDIFFSPEVFLLRISPLLHQQSHRSQLFKWISYQIKMSPLHLLLLEEEL